MICAIYINSYSGVAGQGLRDSFCSGDSFFGMLSVCLSVCLSFFLSFFLLFACLSALGVSDCILQVRRARQVHPLVRHYTILHTILHTLLHFGTIER